jgi:gliding motility-associated-like protein
MRTITPYIAGTVFFLLSLLITGEAASQISSPNADVSDTIEYPDFPETDLYFVFSSPEQDVPVTGTLIASSPGGTPGFDFSWSRYNPVTGNFDPPFFTETGVDESAVSDLQEGCYSVHITSIDTDTLFRAWVFLNDLSLEVEKGIDGKVMPYRYTCDFLRLVGTVVPDTLPYYDLQTGKKLYLPNGIRFKWTSDDPEYQIFGAESFLSLTIYNQPPYSRPPTKDTRFTLTAVDSFNLSRSDEVLYESVHVRAGFTMWYEEKSDEEEEEVDGTWTESERPEEESPLEVRFINDSENGVEFVWTLVDSAKTGEDSEYITYDVNDSVIHTYYIPGYYYPGMVAYSEAGCVDSFPLAENPEVHVLPSELDVPNVFTPNGDDVNDFFVVRSQSLKNFRITIYDQRGRKVYEYEHQEGRMEWEGWDGTIHGKGDSFAQPGVYYYVIEALGWDATRFRDRPPYTGFVYLIREID